MIQPCTPNTLKGWHGTQCWRCCQMLAFATMGFEKCTHVMAFHIHRVLSMFQPACHKAGQTELEGCWLVHMTMLQQASCLACLSLLLHEPCINAFVPAGPKSSTSQTVCTHACIRTLVLSMHAACEAGVQIYAHASVLGCILLVLPLVVAGVPTELALFTYRRRDSQSAQMTG